VALYLALVLGVFVALGLFVLKGVVPIKAGPLRLIVYCGLWGGVGGVTYCLRGIYLNACVRQRWDDVWLPWYYIRPLVSCITGAISCLFLMGGLIVLQAERDVAASNFVFYALAFIAGLNVDRFLQKIEGIAHSTWGLEKSRTSEKGGDDA